MNFGEDESESEFYCDRYEETVDKHQYIGFGNDIQRIIMILLSIFGIFINLYFLISSIIKIIKKKNSKYANISSIEKILCFISICETFISICWLLNFWGMKTIEDLFNSCSLCRALGMIELFFYLFDWMILMTTLIQIKQILVNPLETLKTEKIIFKYIIFCAIFGIATDIFGFFSDVEGVSPMLTCFIDVSGWEFKNEQKIYKNIFYALFFLIPLSFLLYGIYQVFSIIRLPQYKLNKEHKTFFRSYLQYVFTYIILALLLISVYVLDIIIEQQFPNDYIKIYFNIVTILSCSTPLIVGTIRLIKTKLIKKLLFCSCCNKKKCNKRIDYKKDELIKEKDNDEYQFVRFENDVICKEFKKIFIGISFILDKSKTENEEDLKENSEKEELNLINNSIKSNSSYDISNINIENDKDNHYIINKQEILKDFDLEINEDIFVLGQEEINIQGTEYLPIFFKNIRNADNIKVEDLVKVFMPKNVTPDLFQKTNDSNYYINSTNKQFILRSISLEEIEFYKKILKKGKINEYLEKNKDSIINRVYGLYHLKIDDKKNYYIALMENIYESLDIETEPLSQNNDDIRESKSFPKINKNKVEKKMYLNENEINEKIGYDNDDDLYSDNRRISVVHRTFIRRDSIFSLE